jgi:ABC-2 type transport system ATP-binding protein
VSQSGTATGAALEVRGLVKRYAAVTAVADLSFTVSRGSVTGFLGPNGAGKTTTMRVLLGLAGASEGSALIDGVPYFGLKDPIRRVGALLEITGFHPGRTGRDHLRVMALQGGVAPERVRTTLRQVGMEEAAERRVGGYSLGMRQRLGLATALLGDPDILVLDEPANGLDPAGVAWLRGFLRAYADAGRTVFVSSHVLAEVGQIADHVIVVDRGRLLAEGPVEELIGSSDTVAVRTPDPVRLRAALERASAGVMGSGKELRATGLAIERVGEIAAAEGITLHELRREEATLEQAFLRLTGEQMGLQAPPDEALPPPPPGGAP